jgi:uncharacterized OB-fold protein
MTPPTATSSSSAEPELLSAPLVVEFPFTRSTGPVLGAFLTGLREGVVLGSRGSDGRVHVPPAEYDPVTAEALRELVALPPTGTVTTWAWNPKPSRNHPLRQPFAWVLVRLDGADTALLHALDAPEAAAVSTGMRVRARFRPEGERTGAITDIECFEPLTAEPPGVESPGAESPGAESRQLAAAPEFEDPVTQATIPARLDYVYHPGRAQTRYLRGFAEGRVLAERCPECTRVYIPPRGACPTCGTATSEPVELPTSGTITTFCIVNIAAKGLDIEVPYCYAYVLLDGAHVGLHARIGGVPYDEVHIGQRVAAVWDDRYAGQTTSAAISHFVPSGEPDADPETYRRWM